jgi:hypothetical protein
MSPDAPTDAPTGWVYRSDATPVPPAVRAAPAAPSAAAPGAPRRSDARATPQPARSARGWLESGLTLVTVPVAITVGVMLAPMIWILAARPRR